MRLSPFLHARLRSITGSIIGLYVTMHLGNHALGLISVDAQEAARPYVMAFWHSPVGQVFLYGSLVIHAACALVVLARRRDYHLPTWQWVQLGFGLAIPYLLLVHIVNTRGTRVLTGIDINYPYEIANLWVDPWTRLRQVALVALVWGHFVAGLHFWLRTRRWYQRAFPAILMFYVLLPLAALLGFAEVGMTMTAHARQDPAWLAHMKALGVPADPGRAAARAALRKWAGEAWLGLVAVIFLGAQFIHWLGRGRRFRVTYPEGFQAEGVRGMSILEVSRLAHRPHVAVCGGRARCTTCRVRIEHSAGLLPPPDKLEADALARIRAPDDLRLACQLRPAVDLAVDPLIHPRLAFTAGTSGSPRGREFGEERQLTVLFIDLRGSTRLAEAKMPYDVVFILNHYFAVLAEAVDTAGGLYSNFTGDGLMAIFGLEDATGRGAEAALLCARRALEKIATLNRRLASELAEPLVVGIGVHTGPAIVGRMGPPKAPILSALGDTVNTAARLESATKELGAPVVVSRDTLEAAGLVLDEPFHDLSLRGRTAALPVCALTLADLRALDESGAVPA